jgi:hypothetical protein
MPDWIWFVLVVGVWFALQKWILPRAGVST